MFSKKCYHCAFPHRFTGEHCPQCGHKAIAQRPEPAWSSKEELEANLLHSLLKDEANPAEAFRKMQRESEDLKRRFGLSVN